MQVLLPSSEVLQPRAAVSVEFVKQESASEEWYPYAPEEITARRMNDYSRFFQFSYEEVDSPIELELSARGVFLFTEWIELQLVAYAP